MDKKNVFLSVAVLVITLAISSWAFKPTVNVSVESPRSFGSAFGLNDLSEFEGGVEYHNVVATATTATTYTLAGKDIYNTQTGALYDTIMLTPQTGDITLTFPASSTMSNLLPRSGYRGEQCWQNASTTAGIDITFAAGTGIDLETASSSPTDLTILANEWACFKWVRASSTSAAFDFGVLMTEYTNGD